MLKYQVVDRAPEYHVDRYGLGHDVLRHPPCRGRQDLLAVRAFRLPVLDLGAAGDIIDRVQARAWVPMDDTHMMFVGLTWKQDVATRAAEGRQADSRRDSRGWIICPTPPTGMAAGGRCERRRTTISSIATRSGTIRSIPASAISNAGSGDHREHGRHRRSLLRASGAKRSDDHADPAAAAAGGAGAARQGAIPPGVDDPVVYQRIRSGERILKETDWQAAYEDGMRAALRPVTYRQAAE